LIGYGVVSAIECLPYLSPVELELKNYIRYKSSISIIIPIP